VFHIEAETEDGLWRATAPPWTFVIRPAFYETWWFYGTFALAAGVGIGAAWRFRLQLDRRRHAMVLAERMRLSREIHDTLLQSMVGVSLQLEDLALEPDRPLDQLRRRLLAIRRQVEGCMRDARRSIQNLRSPLLERKDLVGAIREAGATATSGTSVDFSVSTTGDSRRYPSHIEYEILRIAQEAVINAVRHAHASRIEVLLRFDADCVALEVKDDGSGPSHPEHDSETHFGVASMTERAESLGGRFSLGLSSPSGTRIEAIIPIPLQS
jgi:signal transduction histidine kinase